MVGSTPLTPALMYRAPTIGIDEVARRAISDQKSFWHAAIAVQACSNGN
jgi:hypothetical protein